MGRLQEEARMPTNRPRMLIADDHALVAELYRSLFETDYEVVGTVNDGRAMVRVAAKMKPDIVLVDIGMPLLNGLDAGLQVKEILPQVKLIFVTANTDIEVAAEAFRRGASGYLVKTCTALEVVTAVRQVLSGISYISPSLCIDDIVFLSRTKTELIDEHKRITPRQREVLQLLAEGKQMKEVGCILNMTPRTVAFHKYRMMKQIGAKSDTELVRYAIRHHVICS